MTEALPHSKPQGDENRGENAKDKSDSTGDVVSLFLVQYGQDFPSEVLKAMSAELVPRGFRVKYGKSFDRKDPPTYFVVSTQLLAPDKPNYIAKKFGFPNANDFRQYLVANNCLCVTKDWIMRETTTPASKPRISDRILWLSPPSSHDAKRSAEALAKASSGEPSKRLKSATAYNQELSKLFHRISYLYDKCPLEETELWKAYQFNFVATRLTRLDFDVNLQNLSKIRSVRGVGPSSVKMIEQYLNGDKLERLEELENNPRRQALRELRGIYGVGWKRALELESQGYKSIKQLREDVKAGKLKLERNQYVGLLCYEDLLEKMDRSEVESIAEAVKQRFEEVLPGGSYQIMGSYYRGAKECGDVDILVVHKDHMESIPPDVLGKVMDSLKTTGFIEHHLTLASGMDPDNFETLPKEASEKLLNADSWGRHHAKKKRTDMSMYMGIIKSPVNGRKRRLDVKFYPYRERVFASLYFGCGKYCNRSLRYWAHAKFGYHMTDHGLFMSDKSEVRVLEASTEREVFNILNLVWKEPEERDGFDAIVPRGGDAEGLLDPISKGYKRFALDNHD